MNRVRGLSAPLILNIALILASPLSASATPWNALVVFGDSLSDAGNAFALSGGLFPPSPPYAERFSNGPVAAEYLAGHLGVPLTRSSAGGTDFAVAGATTGLLNYNFEVNFPAGINQIGDLKNSGIAGQIGQFAASNPVFDPSPIPCSWCGVARMISSSPKRTTPIRSSRPCKGEQSRR